MNGHQNLAAPGQNEIVDERLTILAPLSGRMVTNKTSHQRFKGSQDVKRDALLTRRINAVSKASRFTFSPLKGEYNLAQGFTLGSVASQGALNGHQNLAAPRQYEIVDGRLTIPAPLSGRISLWRGGPRVKPWAKLSCPFGAKTSYPCPKATSPLKGEHILAQGFTLGGVAPEGRPRFRFPVKEDPNTNV